MSKVIYKVVDYRGRITIPWEFRKYLGLKGGDIVRIEADGDKVQINVSKMDIIDVAGQNLDVNKAYANAAIKAMTPEERLELVAQIVKQLQGI